MGKSCSRWNSGLLVRWRNLKKRVMKTTAVVTMNTDSRAASRGSRGELEPWRGLTSSNKGESNESKSRRAGGLISPPSLTFISNIELSRDLPLGRSRAASACCRAQRAFRGGWLWWDRGGWSLLCQEGGGCDVGVRLHLHRRRGKGGEGVRGQLRRSGGLQYQRGWKGFCRSWKSEKWGINLNNVRKYVCLNTDKCF